MLMYEYAFSDEYYSRILISMISASPSTEDGVPSVKGEWVAIWEEATVVGCVFSIVYVVGIVVGGWMLEVVAAVA